MDLGSIPSLSPSRDPINNLKSVPNLLRLDSAVLVGTWF